MSGRRFWLATVGGLAVITLCLGLLANHYYLRKAEQNTASELILLAQLRRGALERYLKTAESEIRFWATNAGLLDIYHSARKDWEARRGDGEDPGAAARRAYVDNNPHPLGHRAKLLDAGDGTQYSVQHLRAQPLMRLLLSERGYYDFFAITPAGEVLYTVQKEDDYGTNLVDGPYRDSGLGEVFRKVLAAPPEAVLFTDFARYAPSGDQPAMFMATGSRDKDGVLTGVWALQLPTDRIIEVMRPSTGFGDTGQIYVVGEDLFMRSDSRFSKESTVLEINADSDTVRLALAGETGVAFTRDYRGVEVLSAYTSTRVGDGNWAIMSEIGSQELLKWASGNRPGLAGRLLLGLTLAIWSTWYIRRAGITDSTSDSASSLDLDLDLDPG